MVDIEIPLSELQEYCIAIQVPSDTTEENLLLKLLTDKSFENTAKIEGVVWVGDTRKNIERRPDGQILMVWSRTGVKQTWLDKNLTITEQP